MCDVCISNAVKHRMQSRRGFFTAAATAGAGAAIAPFGAPRRWPTGMAALKT